MKCNHKLVRLYYRKRRKGLSYQPWIVVRNKWICNKCEGIMNIDFKYELKKEKT